MNWLLTIFLIAAALASLQAESPLADAVEKTDHAKVRQLLKEHADVSATQPDGMTALHWAVYLDDLEMATLLVKAGANPSTENHYGISPLSLACLNGNTDAVELLLEAGADANTTLRGGE